MTVDYEGQEVETGIVRRASTWCQPCKTLVPVFYPAEFSVEDGVWTRRPPPPAGKSLC